MRKRIEARLLRELGRRTPGLPCGDGQSAALHAYPPAPSGERSLHTAANRHSEEEADYLYGESPRHICSEAFSGMDIQKQSPLPLAAEPSSARNRYESYVCLPFIAVLTRYKALEAISNIRFRYGRSRIPLCRVISSGKLRRMKPPRLL